MTVNQLANEATGGTPGDTPGWRSESECRKHPTRWWFAGGHRETLQAKAVCAECSVQQPCLDFALSRPDLLGIWAATTPNERTALRRARRPRPVDGSAPADAVSATVDRPAVTKWVDPVASSLDCTAVAPDPTRAAPIADRFEPDGPVPSPRRSGGLGRDAVQIVRDELLTPAEAAHKLGVTPNTVTRWSRAGKISAIQTMGGHRRFRRSEIERLLGAATSVNGRAADTRPVTSPSV